MAKEKKFYTISEAARKLGISRQAVHLAIQKGHLKAHERKAVISEWRISPKDLESYQPSGRHQASGKKND